MACLVSDSDRTGRDRRKFWDITKFFVSPNRRRKQRRKWLSHTLETRRARRAVIQALKDWNKIHNK